MYKKGPGRDPGSPPRHDRDGGPILRLNKIGVTVPAGEPATFHRRLAMGICPLVHRLITQRKSSKGRGFSGWNYKALLALFPATNETEDHLRYLPLADLLLFIIAGKLDDPRFRQFLTVTRNVALRKPNKKPRPIGMLEVIMRLAGCVATRLFSDKLHASLDAADLGVKPGGCEAVGPHLNHLIRHDPDTIIISKDMKNAFNSINTQNLLNVGETVPELAPYLNGVYGNGKTAAYTHGATSNVRVVIESDRGGTQGESAMSWVFDIALNNVLQAARAAGAPAGVSVLSIHDDLTVTGKDAHPFNTSDTINGDAAAAGLHPNLQKHVALCVSNSAAVTQAAAAGAAARGYQTSTQGIVIAGAPVGTDNFIAIHLDEQADVVVKMLDATCAIATELGLGLARPPCDPIPGAAQAPNGPDDAPIVGHKGATQRLLALVRMCTSSKFAHLLRTCPPFLTEGPARRIDDAVVKTVMHLLGHHPDAFPHAAHMGNVRARIFLPINMGGMGFTSLADSRHASYVTSLLLCAPSLEANGIPLTTAPGGDWVPLFSGLREAIDALRTAPLGGAAPGSLANKLRFDAHAAGQAPRATRQLQSNLMKALHKVNLTNILNTSTDAARVAIQSSLGKHSGAFLLSTGGHPQLQMHNMAFRDAVNFRLLLSTVGSAPAPPGSGRACAPFTTNRTCPACHRYMSATGTHSFARASCPAALHPSSTHAIVMQSFRGVIRDARSQNARLHGNGLEGGPLSQIWAPAPGAPPLPPPLPPNAPAAAVAAHAAAMRCTRGDAWVQLSEHGNLSTVVVDATVTAANVIASNIPPGPGVGPLPPPAKYRDRVGVAATEAAEAKIALYNAKWSVPNDSFYPLAFEIHGAANFRTHAFIERVARAVFPGVGANGSDFGGKRATFKSFARQRISVALQTANARAIYRWRHLSWSKAVPVGAAAAPG